MHFFYLSIFYIGFSILLLLCYNQHATPVIYYFWLVEECLLITFGGWGEG